MAEILNLDTDPIGYINSLKSVDEETKKQWIANVKARESLKYEDHKGKWYIPCCEQDLMQINNEHDWSFAINFDPKIFLPVFYDTKQEALDSLEPDDSDTHATGYDKEGNKVKL